MQDYGAMLASLGGGAGGGAPDAGGMGAAPAVMGLGMGAPPSLPGAMPAPTGMGAMPTGSGSSTSKAAADQAILTLRSAKGHFPALGTAIDAMIDQLKQAATKDAPPAPATTPGAPVSDDASLGDSGSDGAA